MYLIIPDGRKKKKIVLLPFADFSCQMEGKYCHHQEGAAGYDGNPAKNRKCQQQSWRRKCLLLSKAIIEAVLFCQKKAGSNLFPADPLCGGHFNNNCFAHASCPFSPGSLWPLPQGPGNRVKGIGVCEPWARGHFRVSLISHRISSRQQKRTRALGKWGSIWSWEREKNQLIQVPWKQKHLMFWEGPQVIIETQTGQGRCEESWAGDYREYVQSCSWNL